MKKSFLKAIALILVICAMQVALVPSVTAASTSVTYDFYERYKDYEFLYHWRTVDTDGSVDSSSELQAGTKVAMEPNKNQIAEDYAARLIDWKIESASGIGKIVKKTESFLFWDKEVAGWASIGMGKNAQTIFRFRSPGTGNYEVDIKYYTTNNADDANTRAEVMIVPAEAGKTYTSTELTSLLSKYRYQDSFSCYDSSAEYKENTKTITYSFLEGQEYFFVVGGGSSYGNPGKGTSSTYLRSLTARYVGEYDPPEDPEYARPVTMLDEALARWEEGFPMVAEANGNDYLAIPIYGGKMYVFNLETNQLVDVVNTGIDVPRGAAADDNGVLYITGASYNIFMYDLKNNQPSKSTPINGTKDANGNTVAFGSLYDISYGDDGNFYTGTDKGHVIRYDPDTDTITPIFLNDKLASYNIQNVGYVSSVLQQGDYIYAAVTNKVKKHYLVKLNKNTFEVAGITDYTSTGPSTYMSYMSITDEGLILGNAKQLMAVDTKTMTLLTEDQFSSALVQCYVSENINGKYYYVSGTDRHLYCYDPAAAAGQQVTKVTKIGQFLDCHGKTVTLDRDGDGKDEKYLLVVESAKDYEITLVNPETGASAKMKLPIEASAGASTGVNSLTAGVAGSNELYYGGFTSNQVQVYNVVEGRVTGQIQAAGIQTDAIYVNGNTIYTGNYTEAQLARLNRNTNKPEVLMTLHNSLFNQSRIHSITGGNGKIFFGTFPYVYAYGGVLAWYDTTTGLASVAVGPNPEDVYYSKDNTNWYANASCTGTPVTAIVGTTAGKDVDGVDGVVLNQGIKDVAYHNGILYAATSREGGTNSVYTSDELGKDTSAVIIAYDVAAKKVIATFDPAEYGFVSPVPAINGIEMDEKGTLWCVLSETLFTLTLNADNTFTYTEKLSFDKLNYDGTQNRANSTILFKDGYVYAAFERIGGLCKVNMTNPSDHTNLLPYVTSNNQVPESFAFGEDGNLYFLQGSSLKMLVVDSTDEEWAAAAAVTELIKTMTPETVAQAKAAYDQLTLREKSLVQNYADLEQAEADNLIQAIADLGEITWDKKDQVQTLLTTYKALPKSQQNKITNYPVLAAANQTLQLLEQNASVIVIDGEGNLTYYETWEQALAAVTAGSTIRLQDDVTAEAADIPANVILDLNGYTLTADAISGKVMDSQDGKGLIKTNAKSAMLTSPDNQLILWDNATENSGYRIFNYRFVNLGADAKGNDASESNAYGSAVKSFWSDLIFTNPYAYTLAASANSGLQIGFEVTWTPDGGETTEKTFAFDSATMTAWALAEESNTNDQLNYCFYIRLTGFEALQADGLVTVKPVMQTAFNASAAETTQLTVNQADYAPPELQFEVGFGAAPEG